MVMSEGDCINNSFDTLSKVVDWLEAKNSNQATSAHAAAVIKSIYNPSVSIAQQCLSLYGQGFYQNECISEDSCFINSLNLWNRFYKSMQKICLSPSTQPDDVHLSDVVNYIGTHLHMGEVSFELHHESSSITTGGLFSIVYSSHDT